MNSSLKHAWSAALRSGKYIQNFRALRSIDGTRHCAMGVLMDIIDHTPYESLFGWSAFISGDTLKRIGLSQEAQVGIARLNDGGWTFEQIADLIDQDADLDITLQVAVAEELKKISSVPMLWSSIPLITNTEYTLPDKWYVPTFQLA